MPKLPGVSQHRDLHRAQGKMLKAQPGRGFLDSFEAIREETAEGKEPVFDVASRERCRMSKRSMLELFE